MGFDIAGAARIGVVAPRSADIRAALEYHKGIDPPFAAA